MDMGPDTPFDPSTLSPNDPLRDTSVQEWMDKLKVDHPDIAGKLITDPQGAVQELANRGVEPPPMSFAPMEAPLSLGVISKLKNAINPPEGGLDPTADQGPYTMDKGPATGPLPPTQPPSPVAAPVAAPSTLSALDPEENPNPVASGTVPTPTPRPTDTDISSQKKKDDSGASEFAKMMGALKPVQPPPLAVVGTPSVRSASHSGAPNVASLLQLIGQQNSPSPVSTLGRLLVAGKA